MNGVCMSEPHTSDFNTRLSLIYVAVVSERAPMGRVPFRSAIIKRTVGAFRVRATPCSHGHGAV